MTAESSVKNRLPSSSSAPTVTRASGRSRALRRATNRWARRPTRHRARAKELAASTAPRAPAAAASRAMRLRNLCAARGDTQDRILGMRIGINVSRLAGQRKRVGRYLEYMLKFWSVMLDPSEEMHVYLRHAVPPESIAHLKLGRAIKLQTVGPVLTGVLWENFSMACMHTNWMCCSDRVIPCPCCRAGRASEWWPLTASTRRRRVPKRSSRQSMLACTRRSGL